MDVQHEILEDAGIVEILVVLDLSCFTIGILIEY
jgi:hypothetical protein